MKAPDYWKRYPVETPPAAIERLLQVQTFSSGGRRWELLFLDRAASGSRSVWRPSCITPRALRSRPAPRPTRLDAR